MTTTPPSGGGPGFAGPSGGGLGFASGPPALKIVTDPGNPNTSSFAVAKLADGSVFDPEHLGPAVYYERLDVPDPDPGMAERIAAQRLAALGGAAATITLKCVPQPWLEPGQIIAIDYNGTRAMAQVAGWSMDVGALSEMTVTLRAWRVTSEIGLPLVAPVSPEAFTLNTATPINLDPAVDQIPTVLPTPPQSPPDTA